LKKQKAKKAGGSAPSKKEETAEAAGAAADAPPPPPAEDESSTAVEEATTTEQPSSPSQAAPSLAQQSKLRSTSFRKGSISTSVGGPLSPGPFSPDGETAPDIYRKHVARIEELERENKRLAKDSTDHEKRWQKAEEELADLREADGDSKKEAGADSQLESLVRSRPNRTSRALSRPSCSTAS
jgi:hypothetical protein